MMLQHTKFGNLSALTDADPLICTQKLSKTVNTSPDPESSLVKMSESGHFTVINLIN